MTHKKVFSFEHFLTVTGAVVLFACQAIATGAAAAWALSGIFGLGQTGLYVFGVVFVGLACYASYAFARQALKAEPIYI